MIAYLEYLNAPAKIGVSVIVCFVGMQVVGELLEFKGKVVPEFLKIRKFLLRKNREKTESTETLKEVKRLLEDVNTHYSADNIQKRDSWIGWVNEHSAAYDNFIIEISKNLADVTNELKNNTKLTQEMFVQHSRDRIIDFAAKAADENIPISREEFNRIFKVYDKYEKFLEEHDMTNGEIDVAYRIINESYEAHMRNHSFIEDIRGYTS